MLSRRGSQHLSGFCLPSMTKVEVRKQPACWRGNLKIHFLDDKIHAFCRLNAALYLMFTADSAPGLTVALSE